MKTLLFLMVLLMVGCTVHRQPRSLGNPSGTGYQELANPMPSASEADPDISPCIYMEEIFDDMRGSHYAVLNDTIIVGALNNSNYVGVSITSTYLETYLRFIISPSVCIENYSEIIFKFADGTRHNQFENIQGLNCKGRYSVDINDINKEIFVKLIDKVRIYHDNDYTEFSLSRDDAYKIQNSLACIMNNYRNERAGIRQLLNER